MSDPSGPLHGRLRSLQALLHDAVDATVFLVDEGHESSARAFVRVVSTLAPPLEQPVRVVDAARRVPTRGILGAVRLVNRSVQALSDAAAPDPTDGDEPPLEMHSERLVSLDGAADQLVGVLNGFLGDHLAASRNGLDLRMRLRHGDRWLTPDPARLARDLSEPTSRVVVLVHGLAATELSWSLGAEQKLGDASAHFGPLLRDALGYTPIYARYNTGRAVADNGQSLSEALQSLVDAWPVPVDEVVLVGHSIGGLVSRSATWAAATSGHDWLARLTHVACLGSPHRGAPLARFGEHAAVALRDVDLPATRIMGRILDRRSPGVKDLQHRELEATGPLLDHVTYLFVAGTLARDGAHPLAAWFGDALVPVHSASGPAGPTVIVRHVGKVAHQQLQTHPEVYQALLEALSTRS